MVLVINVNISLVGLTLLSSMFQISSTMEWHGLKDVEPLQDAKDKGLAQDPRSRLYIFYFSDPRSHWVYRKSQYYQEGMRCCLMACLLKVLSDMLQSPHYFLTSTYVLNKKSNSALLILSIQRHRVLNVIAIATNPSKSVSPIGIPVSPRWDCNLSVYVHYQNRSHRDCVIGPTEITMQTLCSSS